MTRKEVVAIVKERIDKLLEEANKEFTDWFIEADQDCCCSGDFEVYINRRLKRLEEYTKEELLEMIKNALLKIELKDRSYDEIRLKLHNTNYAMQNLEKLKKIDFNQSLIASCAHIHELSFCFRDIYNSLYSYDEEWVKAYRSIDVKSVDPIEFLEVEYRINPE